MEQHHEDFVLRNLADMIINRDLLKIKVKNKSIKDSALNAYKEALMSKYSISREEASYFVFKGEISNQTYSKSEQIKILFKNGKIKDVIRASDHLNLKVLSKPVTKYYICFPKERL